MTVSNIGDKKIKVTLSLEERFRLFGDTEILNPESPSVRAALRIILRKLKYEGHFLEDCSSVCIDLYKDNLGGFIIYLTKLKLQKFSKNTFLFTSPDNLLDAISSIKKRTLDYRVFADGNRFYLEIGNSVPSNLIPHIKEFCDNSAE